MSGERRVIQIEVDGSQGEISAARLEQALRRIDRAIDPLGVATRNFARDQALLDTGLRAGSLTVEQHATKVAALGRQFDTTRSRLETMTVAQERETSASRRAAQEALAHADAVARVDAVLRQAERTQQKAVDAFWKEAEARQAVIRVAREQQNAESAQARFNQLLGVNRLAGGSASASASVFASMPAPAEIEAVGKMSRQTAAELKNLGFQLNDLFTGLASGQRPMQVLVQQGGQLAQTTGAWGAAFRMALSPVGLATAAMVGFIGVMSMGINRAGDLDHQIKQLNTTIATTANAGGYTAVDLRSQANAFAHLPGVNRETAMQATQALASNPLINADVLQRALPLIRDFATATGQDVPNAAKAMASALTGGYQAAAQLDRQFQLLTLSELDQIRALEEQGRKGDAANVVLGAMQRQLKGLADGALTPAARAANDLGNAWDRLLDTLAKTGIVRAARAGLIDLMNVVSGTTDETEQRKAELVRAEAQLADAYRRLSILRSQLSGEQADWTLGVPGVAERRQRVALSDIITFGQVAGGIRETGDLDSATSLMEGFKRAAIDAGEALAQVGGPGGAKGFLHDIGVEAAAAARALDPAGEEMKRLENLQTLLTTAMANGKMTADAYADAMARVGLAMQRVQTPENILADLDRDVKLAGMSPAARAGELAARRIAEAKGNEVQQEAARKKAIAAYGAGQGVGLGEQIAGIRAGAAGVDDVVAAYARGAEAGRRAEIQLKAIEAQHKSGKAAIEAYAAALLEQDAAQRRIEGAKLVAETRDEARYQTMLTDALRAGIDAYDDATIAVRVLREVEAGRFKEGSKEAEEFRRALGDLAQQQARQQAIALNRQYDPQAQLRIDIENIEKLARTGEVTGRALQGALVEAYARAGQASDSFVEGATAGLMQYARTAQQAGAVAADAVVRAATAADDTIAKLLLNRKVDLRQFLDDITLDLTRGVVRQAVTGPLTNDLLSLMGVAPRTGLSGATVSIGGVPFVPASGGGNGGLGGPSLIGGLLGDSGASFLGSVGSWLRTPIGFNPLPPNMTFGPLAPNGTGLAGSFLGDLTPLQIGGSAFSAGMGIFNLAQGRYGSGIGGLLGAGAALIPGLQWAAPILPLVGGLLDGLFKSKPDIKSTAVHDYDIATGRYGSYVRDSQGVTAPRVPQVGDDALKLLGAFGGRVAPGMAGPSFYTWAGFEDGRFDASTTGPLFQSYYDAAVGTADERQAIARRRLWTDAGDVALPIEGVTKDSEGLMKQLAVEILKTGVRSGAFTGLSATSSTIIRNFRQADPTALGETLAWGRDTYDQLQRAVPATGVETAMKQVRDSFEAAILKAKEYALATDGLVAAQRRAVDKIAGDFGQSIEDQILGMKDPVALQRVQLEREREATLREWDYLHGQFLEGNISTLIERNKIQQLYDDKLKAITDATLNQLTAGLVEYERRLRYGDLSAANPMESLAGALGTYQANAARALAGDSTALAQYQVLAEAALRQQIAFSGNNYATEDLRRRQADEIATLLGRSGQAGANSDEVVAELRALRQLMQDWQDRNAA